MYRHHTIGMPIDFHITSIKRQYRHIKENMDEALEQFRKIMHKDSSNNFNESIHILLISKERPACKDAFEYKKKECLKKFYREDMLNIRLPVSITRDNVCKFQFGESAFAAGSESVRIK
ncbi:hypothetical protein GJ496_003989 [Pomphorhynchus laevis]|nr:hypothetical protein GJ496_003989 [Pomphorhynchus laevis]